MESVIPGIGQRSRFEKQGKFLWMSKLTSINEIFIEFLGAYGALFKGESSILEVDPLTLGSKIEILVKF